MSWRLFIEPTLTSAVALSCLRMVRAARLLCPSSSDLGLLYYFNGIRCDP